MPAKTTRLLLLCLSLTLLLSVCPQNLNAQVLYGSVVGTVTDQSGAVLPGAQVTLTNDGTGLKRQGTTDSTGHYRVLDLPEGTYTLGALATGFKPLKKTNIAVTIGQVNAQDLQLQVGGMTQEVTVQATAAVLQTQKADVHTTLSSYAIGNLPLNIYRNFQAVELLAPGVFSDSAITGSYPNSPADTPDRSLRINANGLPQHINTTRVDGATNIFIWLPDHMLIVPPQETIQEVNVQTANFDVEKGLTAGVATDVVTKSGSNAFHGSAYGFHTDQALDARNLFDYSPSKPTNIINNDGFTLGGPIKKNKLFFFGNWDGLRERTTTSGFRTLPPMDWRQGDFRSALGDSLFDANGNPVMVPTTEGGRVQLQQGMVFDPSTGNSGDGTGRAVFSSGGQVNVIPANRLNQGALNYLKLLPAPGIAGPLTSNSARNHFVSKGKQFNRDIYTLKMDWNRSDRHAIWGKYTLQNFSFDEPFDFDEAGGSGSGPNHQRAQTMTVGHTWTLSANKVLTGHVGWSRMGEEGTPPGFGKALGQTVLGIPGTNVPANDIRYSGFPGISISGFSNLGSPTSWTPVFRNDWTLTNSHNLTVIRGSHEFRFGFDSVHNHLNHWQPEIVCCPRGNLSFSQDNTFLNLPADPNNSSGPQMKVFTNQGAGLVPTGFTSDRQNSAAEFDLGLLSQVEKSEQFIKSTGKDWQFGWYGGDRWRVTPKFTADLGLRYEYYPLIRRDGTGGGIERYDPSTNTLFLGGRGSIPKNVDVTTSKKLFAPRIGLAYRPNDKTVIRSGFGISYDTLPLERPLRGFYPLAIGASNFVPSSKVSRFLPFTTFQQGIPLIQDPDITQGKTTPPPDVSIWTLAPGPFSRAYLESWNLFVERTLPGQFILGVGYVGNHLVHEFNGRNINAATLGGGSKSQPLSQLGRFVATGLFAGYLDSHYNALQVTLNRHNYKGLFVQGSYTYSKAISYADDTGWQNQLRFNCPPSPGVPQGCQALNRGAPFFDHTHMLKMAFVYELPLGAGKRWANTNRAGSALLGGWQLTGIFSGWTGAPLTPSQTGNFLVTPGTNQNPDLVGAINILHGQGPGEFWFDTSAFLPVETTRIGTAGRGLSWLRGPGLAQMDMSLFRHIRIKERYALEMRLETQNLTNTPHFGNPDNFCSDINGKCGGSFGQITSAFGQRIVQLGAKMIF